MMVNARIAKASAAFGHNMEVFGIKVDSDGTKLKVYRSVVLQHY